MELEELREKLDETDRTLEEKFAERMRIIEQIGEFKLTHGLPILDPAREAEVITKHTEGQPEELRPYMEEFFRSVMAVSRRFQEDLRANPERSEKASGDLRDDPGMPEGEFRNA